ncbi:MAG TPA: SpoIIE family protein phosphatase [Candidatus Sulfotelmatobacter sp.]|nr:SpoIIE family protein phosphatase [Candidatus Sulfotelmatobacter sp.]
MFSRFRSPRSGTPAAVEPIPTVFPKIGGADLAAMFAGKRVAGDFYDGIRTSPERVLIGLLDVAGRRQDNRFILNHAQQIFRTSGAKLFSASDINESDAMTELCLELNRGLIDICCGVHSCPAFIACYHEKFGTLCYTNAGHTPGLLRDQTGILELPSTGLPLGLFSHATCEAPTVGLEKGASVLLVSRGVVEVDGRVDDSSDAFGLEQVKELFRSAPLETAKSLCSSVIQAASAFETKSSDPDDRTALALVRLA